MTRYSFRLSDKGLQRGVGVSAFYGEVGWDEDLATFFAHVWRRAVEEPLAAADQEPVVSCGERLCEFTEVYELARCLADRCEADLDLAEIAARWGERLEADRDRYIESLSVEQEMNLLARVAADP
jgi:hypothetical protein